MLVAINLNHTDFTIQKCIHVSIDLGVFISHVMVNNLHDCTVYITCELNDIISSQV